ncbi:hypothetical protein IQ267_17170 [filamentous cyanobacterium LEGE 07170]|nr:hypothetical protein [filamentous cyanobacterium LEGE 07170]
MSFQELREQATRLSVSDRLALMSAIIDSLKNPNLGENTPPSMARERSGAIERMRGLLKTEQPAPTDEEVAVLLEERRLEKYS